MSIQTKGSDEVIWNVLYTCKWYDVESEKQARVKERVGTIFWGDADFRVL